MRQKTLEYRYVHQIDGDEIKSSRGSVIVLYMCTINTVYIQVRYTGTVIASLKCMNGFNFRHQDQTLSLNHMMTYMFRILFRSLISRWMSSITGD